MMFFPTLCFWDQHAKLTVKIFGECHRWDIEYTQIQRLVRGFNNCQWRGAKKDGCFIACHPQRIALAKDPATGAEMAL
jgi:hypothetical protein